MKTLVAVLGSTSECGCELPNQTMSSTCQIAIAQAASSFPQAADFGSLSCRNDELLHTGKCPGYVRIGHRNCFRSKRGNRSLAPR